MGKKYWSNFLRRNRDKLTGDRAISQADCRKQWSTYLNFSKMYNLVYDVIQESGITEQLPSKVWMDLSGDTVQSEADAVDLQVDLKVKYPDYQIFVDEVGNNTNMKEDGNIGGQFLLKGKGEKATITLSTADTHFTVLGFTAGTGEPIMCAVIFTGKELTTKQQLGVDIRPPLVDGLDGFRKNYGRGKRYPGAPTCLFRNKLVPAFVCCSPKGGITSQILKEMLERMDDLDLFPRRPGGPLPFLLLDGHGSCLQLPFLWYVNGPAHLWKVSIGLPNGTAYRQVGDSSEQNGNWKIALTRDKRDLVRFKV